MAKPQQVSSKVYTHVGKDTYTSHIKYSSRRFDLPGVEAINITNYLALQASYDISSQIKSYKGLEATSIYLSVNLFMFLTLTFPHVEVMVLALPCWLTKQKNSLWIAHSRRRYKQRHMKFCIASFCIASSFIEAALCPFIQIKRLKRLKLLL